MYTAVCHMFLSKQLKCFTKAGGNKEWSFQLIRNVYFVPEIHNSPFIKFCGFLVFSAFYCLHFTGEVIERIHETLQSQWQGRAKFKSLDPLSQHWKHCSSLFQWVRNTGLEERLFQVDLLGHPLLSPAIGATCPMVPFMTVTKKEWVTLLCWTPDCSLIQFRLPSEKMQKWYLNGVCSGKRLVWFVLWH